MPRPYFSEQARAEIKIAARWISQHDPKAASDWTQGLMRQCRLLAGHPGLGRIRHELAIDARVFPYRHHLIFYDITRTGILVLHVVDARQDIPNLPL